MNLELTTTMDLIEELNRRYPTLLVAGGTPRSEEYDTNLFVAHGELGALVTLVHIVDIKVVRAYLHSMEPTDDML